jgi:drug/metabolite transporter (DMT)-like permease
MLPGTVAMVLAAAVAHAVWNLASKFKRGDAVLFVGAYTCASALLCFPISLAFGASAQQMLDGRLWGGAAVSAVLHTAYSLILQAGYDRAELGVVYPVARGIGPVLTMLFAILLLGEQLSTGAMFGASLVVAGILVVTGNPFGRGGGRPLQGLLWGAATGATIAAYTLWDGYSVIGLHLAPVSYYASTLLLQSLILTPSLLRRRPSCSRGPSCRRRSDPHRGGVLSACVHPGSHRHAEGAGGARRAAARVVDRHRLARRVPTGSAKVILRAASAGAAVVLAGIAAISL